eukprot:jgi/Chrzof1/13400/Cz07g31180.t1
MRHASASNSYTGIDLVGCFCHSCKENEDPQTQQPFKATQPSSNRKPRVYGTPVSSTCSKKSVQLFLDLGQKDFSSSKCSVCGMVYAKGQDEDEKLHKSYHISFTQGIKFQGWSRERCLLSDAFQGRLLMVLPSDSATHIKKLEEVCAFVEKLHGMTPGWLLGTQNWKVVLTSTSIVHMK